MKLTIETTDIKEAMAILTNLDATEVKAATEAPAKQEPATAAPAKPAHEEPAKPAHEDEVANKRSEAAKKAAATKKAKAKEAEEKKAEAKKAEAEADPLAGLEDAMSEEEVTMEMVQGVLRSALKADKENKIAIREYFQKHGIVGGVDAIPENLFNDCYEFAQGLM